MASLDVAMERFTKALETLEKAAALHKMAGGAATQAAAESTSQAARRIADLEAEREQLLARIAGLEDELAGLSSLTEEVEGRLDGAMGEIRAALAR